MCPSFCSLCFMLVIAYLYPVVWLGIHGSCERCTYRIGLKYFEALSRYTKCTGVTRCLWLSYIVRLQSEYMW